jgi:predicted nucleotidyltransferase
MELKSEVFKKLARIKSLQAIILYGSFARGEVSPKSDIDLLLVFDSRDEARKQEKRAVEILNRARVKRIIIPTCIGIEEFKESPDLVYNVMRDGKVLYKRIGVEMWPPAKLFGGRPMVIYEFDLAGLSHQKKVKLNRALYGVQVGKYSYKGLVEQRGGYRLGKGAILIPADAETEFDGFFDSNKIKAKKKYVHLISEAF